jgi:hypothetical protein
MRSPLTKAIVAMGFWDPAHSQPYVARSERERAALRAQEACAEPWPDLLDADGQPVVTGFTDRRIAITAARCLARPATQPTGSSRRRDGTRDRPSVRRPPRSGEGVGAADHRGG